MKVSAVICSHNPRPEYLARALAALRKQTLPLAEWELLLIDNASAEPLAGRFDLTWHPNGRIVCEEKLGLSHARARGVIGLTNRWLVTFAQGSSRLRNS
jgi:glycosyltransferase involved in cell wall biosynthesis